MIRIGLFGGVTIRVKENTVSGHLGKKAAEIIAYLTLFKGIPHRREKLSELIWPDKTEQRSRSSLSTTLWRINSLFNSAGLKQHILLEDVARSSIKLEFSSDVYVDCHALQMNVRHGELAVREGGELSIDERQSLRSELEQHAGAFLEGHDGEWVLRERERLCCVYIRGLTLLMHDLTRQGRYEEALEYGRAILASDDMREAVQREVMWLYVMNGQRCEAIAQYRKFHVRVNEELGIEPMTETTLLYQHILNDDDMAGLPSDDIKTTSSGLASVRDFLQLCERNRASMYSALIHRNPRQI